MSFEFIHMLAPVAKTVGLRVNDDQRSVLQCSLNSAANSYLRLRWGLVAFTRGGNLDDAFIYD